MFNKNNIKIFLIFLTSIVTILISLNYINNNNFQIASLIETVCLRNTSNNKAPKKVTLKEFYRYECKNRIRIGGRENYKLRANNPLYRIDGAWFVCFDEKLKPINNKCNILSFGIHDDDTFDYELNQNYGCNVYSFDPFVEDIRFTNIRKSNPALKNSFEIKVNEKWSFYRIGVVGSLNRINKPKQIGGMNTLENIIEMTGLKNKIVDVFKMDIERGEVDVLENFDIDYACKYYKQFMLEAHPESNLDTYMYKLLIKLDKCFLLFHRDTRFFKGDSWGETGHKTEYQNPNGWLLNIKDYKNEVNLATFILSMGELYFVNENFI